MGDRLVLPVIGLLSIVLVAAVAFLLLGDRTAGSGGGAVAALPTVNATLNGAAAMLLVMGWRFVRRKRIPQHRACMLAAAVVSIAFLVSYVTYHALAGSRPFPGQGWIRPVYFTLLVSHIVLAAAMTPLVLTTLWRALSGDFARHRRIARVTLPVWLYVSVTGVIVYWMLYHRGAP
ncbi:MAG: DUF420 domain-containing protein [Candidatus Rokuibacteriota bacterium]